MEFPELGKYCAVYECNKLDFLPVKCDACQKLFCYEHMRYENHNCAEGALRDVQVPVCPLCNTPISVPRGERPDIAVGAHIDNDCQADPTEQKQVFTYKCSVKGCKRREMVPLLCSECNYNYCIIHRHGTDHECNKRKLSPRITNKKDTVKGVSSSRPCRFKDFQGTMDEDEALAHAIALSLNESALRDQGNFRQSTISTHGPQQSTTGNSTQHNGSHGTSTGLCNLS